MHIDQRPEPGADVFEKYLIGAREGGQLNSHLIVYERASWSICFFA